MDRDAEFRDFYLEFDRAATRYAATILGPQRLGELADVVQDAWARAWRMWATAEPARRAPWFFRIVRNCALDRHRAHRDVLPLDSQDHDHATTVDFHRGLDWDDAMRLIATLPVRLRETLWLRAAQDLSYQEIADTLGLPIGTVMSRLNSARRKLHRRLGSER